MREKEGKYITMAGIIDIIRSFAALVILYFVIRLINCL